MVDNRITAWSFSRWRDYEQCPFKASCKYIHKFKEPESPPMKRGTDIHKKAELYIKGLLKDIPIELGFFEREFKKLRRVEAEAEQSLAFDVDWQPTGWFDTNAWCRVKTDASALLFGKRYIVDYKTGKQYEEHADQLELYALAGFITYPEAEEVEAQDWYLDQPPDCPDRITGESFLRKQVKELKDAWARRTRAMLTDTAFSPRPNYGCRKCWLRRGNGDFPGGKGGPCEL